MAGLSTEGGRRSRRSLNCDINMVPMIDLLMVTVSFMLLTTVWTHAQRLETAAPIGSAESGSAPATVLHVDARGASDIAIEWKAGPTVVASTHLPRERIAILGKNGAEVVTFRHLDDAIASSWKAFGTHQAASDGAFDRAIVHASNDAPFSDIAALLDATQSIRRGHARLGSAPAMVVTLADE